MRERPQRDVSNGCSWWCPTYKARKSVQEGSFFAKSKIRLQKWLLLMYLWTREYPVINIYQWF